MRYIVTLLLLLFASPSMAGINVTAFYPQSGNIGWSCPGGYGMVGLTYANRDAMFDVLESMCPIPAGQSFYNRSGPFDSTGSGCVGWQAEHGACFEWVYVDTGPEDYLCPDGVTVVEDLADCPGLEATCADKSGLGFVLPQAGAGYTLQGSTGWMLGCEFRVLNCSTSVCDGCFTGNGTYNEDYSPKVRWGGGVSVGVGGASLACPVSSDPQPHPGFCSPLDANYDAVTDSCPGDEPVTQDCDDPALPDDAPCNWTVPDPETSEPVYNPPAPTEPVIPEDDFNNPPSQNPAPDLPSVDSGVPPGYTGPPSESPGIGNNPDGVPSVDDSPGYSGGSGSGDMDGDTAYSWGNLPSIAADGFYTRQYEGGIAGVFAERMGQMQQTPIFSFANQFKVRNGIGTPPVFTLDATGIGMGVFEFGFFQNETIWLLFKIIVLISTFFLCRRIIFGV